MPKLKQTPAEEPLAAPMAGPMGATATSAVATSPASATFQELAGEVIGALQRALGQALATFPDVKIAADLKRRLDLDAALAWQIFSLANTADPLAADRFIPKAGAMDRFIRTITKAKAPALLCQAVADAYSEFEAFVKAHAGDRASFSAMLSSLQPADRAAWTKLRKAAFRANSGVWGVSVDCSINCLVFHERPSGAQDALSLRGRVGVRGYRAGTGVAMSASTRIWAGSGPPPENWRDLPDAKIMTSSAGLIHEACSQPMPRIEARITPDGSLRDYLALEGLGRQSEATAWWTTFSPDFKGTRTPPHGCSCPCPEPTELLQIDLIMPRTWCDPTRLRTRVVGPDVRFSPDSLIGNLPLDNTAVHLGHRLESLYTPAVPHYYELLHDQLERLGWLGTTFEIFRCAIKYPVLHCTTHVYVE